MTDELSNQWANLSLSEGEDGELEIQKTDVKEIINRGQFCIIGKLLFERIISKETIKSTLVRWWRLKETFTLKILGGNLFLIEFAEAKDKSRVLDSRPWVFEGSLFLVEDFDGRTSPSEFTFDRESFVCDCSLVDICSIQSLTSKVIIQCYSKPWGRLN